MSRYYLTFTKSGYAIFTSHLDMQRLFKRAFKRAGIEISYSAGYNPHPQMSFAQPLSLGYSSCCELLEFKTKEDYEPNEIAGRMDPVMPEGMTVTGCSRMDDGVKSLASRCFSAVYEIRIPVDESAKPYERFWNGEAVDSFMAQEKMIVTKINKKKKAVETDIKSKIRSLKCDLVDGNILLDTELDAGSNSNLSPELLLKSFLGFFDLKIDRSDIEISRLKLNCK